MKAPGSSAADPSSVRETTAPEVAANRSEVQSVVEHAASPRTHERGKEATMTPQLEKDEYISPAIIRQGEMVKRTLGGIFMPLMELQGTFIFRWGF